MNLNVVTILGDNLRKFLTAMTGGLDGRNPLERRCGATGYAGRLKSLINSVFAIVALENPTVFPVPLRGAPRTGGDAGLAPYTHGGIHEHDTVFGPFLHGPGWAC